MATWEEMVEEWPWLKGKKKKYRQHKCGGWISREATVKNSEVYGKGLIDKKAIVEHSKVSGRALITDNARVEYCNVYDSTIIKGNSIVTFCLVTGKSVIEDMASISNSTINDSTIKNYAVIWESTANLSRILKGNIVNYDLYNVTIETDEQMIGLKLRDGEYKKVPIQIKIPELRYTIVADNDSAQIGCKKHKIRTWERMIRKENILITKEIDIEIAKRILGAVKELNRRKD